MTTASVNGIVMAQYIQNCALTPESGGVLKFSKGMANRLYVAR